MINLLVFDVPTYPDGLISIITSNLSYLCHSPPNYYVIFDRTQMVQVERRCATNLSLKEFIEGFALTRTPVVITGLIDHMTVKPWSLDYIKEVCLHAH